MSGPLDGLKVIDLTTVVMGPYATQILGDYGADVIKVESPEGDALRGVGPGRHPGMGPLFLQANRGKRSLVLDLKAPSGREALLKLVAQSDLLISNIRPSALERLKLGYRDLVGINPRLIYTALIGYGQTGPYAARPAYDDLVQGAVGLPRLFESAGGQEPRYVPIVMSDRVTGLYGLSAALAALWNRERTGKGQYIEVPMFETMAQFVLGDHMGGALFEPTVGSAGYARLLSSDRRPYRTSDGYICAMVYSDRNWREFFKAIGKPELFESDSRFANISTRTKHIDELYAMVSEALATRTTKECADLFEASDIPFSPLNTMESLLTDPHLQAVGFFQNVTHPSEGVLKMPSIPARFSESPAALNKPAPRLGEHSREILLALGYDDHGVDALIADGVTMDADNI